MVIKVALSRGVKLPFQWSHVVVHFLPVHPLLIHIFIIILFLAGITWTYLPFTLVLDIDVAQFTNNGLLI